MIIHGDARHIPLADESVQCVVTSPPYWGLRDYGLEPSIWGGEAGCQHEWGNELAITATVGHGLDNSTLEGRDSWGNRDGASQGAFCHLCDAWRGNLALEPTPELYVEHLVGIFREVRRVLRKDGVVWLNLGDSYAVGGKGGGGSYMKERRGGAWEHRSSLRGRKPPPPGLKPKDLVGIPWRVAFALQADGWWLRSDIIWHKPNAMPESVRDRPTRAHEYLFLLSKAARYYYNADAIKEPVTGNTHPRGDGVNPKAARWPAGTPRGRYRPKQNTSFSGAISGPVTERNKRTVWTIPTQPYAEAHFAAYPTKLVEPCILAGSREGDTVFDPFAGSGTTIKVARELNRRGVGLDLAYHDLALRRIANLQPMLREMK